MFFFVKVKRKKNTQRRLSPKLPKLRQPSLNLISHKDLKVRGAGADAKKEYCEYFSRSFPGPLQTGEKTFGHKSTKS